MTTALSRFIALQAEIEEKLKSLKLQVEAIQDETMPEDINWGHVGSLSHINDKLSDLIN